MYDSKRAVAVMLALLAVVGFAVAPTAAVAADEGSLDGEQLTDGTDQLENGTNDTSVQADHGPFPHEVCTDLMKLLHEEAPYDQIIWVSDLPEDLQPPGVPWTVITPRAVMGIVVSATPDQCDIQDPNDPSWDPTREGDNVDPDGDVNASEGEDGEVLVIVEGTLDNSSEGPSGVATADLEITENGTLDPNTRVNDGEKEFGVDPQLQYWSDGTTYFENDVYVIGLRVGGEMDCFGEECNFATRGLPNFVDYPALPSHTDRERPSDGDDGSDGGDSTDGDGSDGADSGPSADDSSGGDGGADSSGGSGADDTSDSDTDSSEGSADGDGPSTDGNDGSDGDGGDSGDGQSTDADANQQQQQKTDDNGNGNAEQAGFGGAKGLGVLVALVVFILGAGAIVPRA